MTAERTCCNYLPRSPGRVAGRKPHRPRSPSSCASMPSSWRYHAQLMVPSTEDMQEYLDIHAA